MVGPKKPALAEKMLILQTKISPKLLDLVILFQL